VARKVSTATIPVMVTAMSTFSAAVSSSIRWKACHIQVDSVDRADQPGFPAVLLAQGAGSQNGGATGLVHDSLRVVQVRSHASSQRRSAWSRSTIPSSSSPAAER